MKCFLNTLASPIVYIDTKRKKNQPFLYLRMTEQPTFQHLHANRDGMTWESGEKKELWEEVNVKFCGK